MRRAQVQNGVRCAQILRFAVQNRHLSAERLNATLHLHGPRGRTVRPVEVRPSAGIARFPHGADFDCRSGRVPVESRRIGRHLRLDRIAGIPHGRMSVQRRILVRGATVSVDVIFLFAATADARFRRVRPPGQLQQSRSGLLHVAVQPHGSLDDALPGRQWTNQMMSGHQRTSAPR